MSDDFGNDFIVLTDEDGEEFELEHLDTLEHKGNTYMAFVPADQSDADESELVILRVEEEGGEEVLVSVDEEAELDEVYQLFIESFEADGEDSDGGEPAE